MEQHEYARLVEYSLHNEPLSASTYTESHPYFAYVLQTENRRIVLEGTTLLAALNEIGRDGWVVYEVIHPDQPHSVRSPMSEGDLHEFERRHGWRPGWVSWVVSGQCAACCRAIKRSPHKSANLVSAPSRYTPGTAMGAPRKARPESGVFVFGVLRPVA